LGRRVSLRGGANLGLRGRFNRRFIVKVAILAILLVQVGLFVSHRLFDFTSSNSAIYVLRDNKGGFEITRDLLIEEADRLVVMLDANCVFTYFMKGLAIARGKPVLELTWNAKQGVGDIKQFRPDGKILSLSFARYLEDTGRPAGLFVGGDLPYGDISRSKDRDTSGFGYYDGKNWNHIWCALNEGFSLKGSGMNLIPQFWTYKGSRVLKQTESEVLLESEHEALINDSKIFMKRYVLFRADDDYFTLRVQFTNASPRPLTYGFAIGDEPWVGKFGASRGDVGWNSDGLVKHESFLPVNKYDYAGYWDVGNPAIDEKGSDFTGYANFVKWFSPAPSYAFFSNDLDECCGDMKPLANPVDRVINIVWLDQLLMPGESRDHVMVFGMANVDRDLGRPVVPEVRIY
jgi:hypothetical protein